MESKPIKIIKQITEEYDLALEANDSRFNREVTIIHRDGTVNHFNSAFLMFNLDWIICFTEHHGTHINCKEDLVRYWESERISKPIEELK